MCVFYMYVMFIYIKIKSSNKTQPIIVQCKIFCWCNSKQQYISKKSDCVLIKRYQNKGRLTKMLRSLYNIITP